MSNRVGSWAFFVGLLLVTTSCVPDAPEKPNDTEQAAASDPSVSRPPSVFVIVLDTLRTDSFLATTDRIPTLPGMQRLLSDSVVFQNGYAPSSWTRTSVATLLTGLPPHAHRVYGRLHKLDDGAITLPELFRDAGYGTFAWSTNPNILPLWGFDQGFDEFVSVPAGNGEKTTAAEVFEAAEKVIRARGSTPTFYYIHLMDPHTPYHPQEEFERRVKESAALQGRERHARARYQRYTAEIAGMEARLAHFIDFLRKEGLYQQSLVVLVSDHGEEFREHGQFHHGKTLYEEVLRVPILMKLPGSRSASGRRTEPATLADVMPTLLEEAGLPRPARIRGRSLVSPTSIDRPLIATLDMDGYVLDSVSQRGWKLIRHGDGTEQLFDLTADPEEKHNRIAEDPDRARALRQVLESQYGTYRGGWHIRGCPGPAASTLRFNVKTSGIVEGIDLEDDDVWPLGAGGGAVTMRLREGVFERLSNPAPADPGAPIWLEALLGDQDEISIRNDAGSTVLEALDGIPLRYRLGTTGSLLASDRLVLEHVRKAATIRNPTLSVCPYPSDVENEPSLSLWYVPEPVTVGSDEVDDEIAERLRALGYQW